MPLLLAITANAFAAGKPPVTTASLIGDARCDADAQCRTIAVGPQRCGGPAAWLAWSTQRTSEAALAEAVAQAASTPPSGDARNSTCGVVRDPGAYCARPAATSASAPAAGRCELRPTGRGAAALPDR